ncbi:hypothetical protein DNI29_02165 [Hymenobacter sediminis]|uniref:hypothetical protein n=1 Tax=Hymenobacter sediminis TaxID=2218621 RepID=UPI000F4FE957|nr:hypothetical protein [Hymenobacter sediminis]RPD49627.1 hypothetical protein DNI29_02165 [Hymenobacter sediminis]
MDYYLIPDQETDCENEFPERLSNFFEQVGGYDEHAEVSQVSRILQIDLSIFQQVSWEDDGLEDGEGADEPSTIWHNLDTVTAVVDSFIAKIQQHPDYFTQVVHNPNRENDLNRLHHILSNAPDEAAAIKDAEEVITQPFYLYPPDRGYLSQGGLREDLHTLRHTLQRYKNCGIARVQFLYM